VLGKLNTCGIAPFRTLKEMARISFHKSWAQIYWRFPCFRVFCSAPKLVPTFGDTILHTNRTWNYFHAFATTLLQGIEVVYQERQFTTPLWSFLLRRDCSCATYVTCICLVKRTRSVSIDGGIPSFAGIIFLKN
jgi:hypothetical protein